MMSIGAHFRGPEHSGSAIQRLIGLAMKTVISERQILPCHDSGPEVNVVFYVSGSLGKFDIQAIEASRFSRKRKLLLVAVPVPEGLVAANDIATFLLESLRQAISIAADVFEKKGVGAFDLKSANAIVEKVRKSLNAVAA